jgi:hypothetical protein
VNPDSTISDLPPLPLDEWKADMTAAVDDICSLGLEILKVHRTASEKAAANAERWKLEERQQDEHAALLRLFDAAENITRKLDDAIQLLDDESLAAATAAIDRHLPSIEEAFLTARHAALDLLRWTRRAGRIDDSTLPDEYRAGYARLVSYSPKFRPRLEAMQQKLLKLANASETEGHVQALLSAITRYNGVMDSARGFVQAIVDPPLELVFQETNLFMEDLKSCSDEECGRLASALNDSCQFLLYDEAEFERCVEEVKPELPDGMEASLFTLPIDTIRILFTVDEDPVFGQLTITLLRVARADVYEMACESVIETLYGDLTQGGSHG